MLFTWVLNRSILRAHRRHANRHFLRLESRLQPFLPSQPTVTSRPVSESDSSGLPGDLLEMELALLLPDSLVGIALLPVVGLPCLNLKRRERTSVTRSCFEKDGKTSSTRYSKIIRITLKSGMLVLTNIRVTYSYPKPVGRNELNNVLVRL